MRTRISRTVVKCVKQVLQEALPRKESWTRKGAGKSKGKSETKNKPQYCQYSWQGVGHRASGPGMSQRQYWNSQFFEWQIFGRGNITWDEAWEEAYEVRRQRDLEPEEFPEKVVPARSASHRLKEEARLRDAPFPALPEEPAGDKKRKKRRKRRKKSPSPDARIEIQEIHVDCAVGERKHPLFKSLVAPTQNCSMLTW